MNRQPLASTPAQSGRWFRRGNSLVVMLGRAGSGEQSELELDGDPYMSLVINPNIDVKAQRALIRMLNTPADRTAATTIIDWINRNQLKGIYQPDQEVPAKAARARGDNWWTILGGRRALVFCAGTRPPRPILIFRKNLDQASLIAVLRAVVRLDAATGGGACSITRRRFCASRRCETLFAPL